MSPDTRSRLLADRPFVAVAPDLIRSLDGDVVAAVVLQHVHYRAAGRDGERTDGRDWYAAPSRELSDEIGISQAQAKRALAKLRDVGVLMVRQRPGYDRTNLYAVDHDHTVLALAGSVPSIGQIQPMDRPDPANVPLLQTDKTNTDGGDADATPTEGQRVNLIAKAYTDRVPLSNFPAVAGVVRKAVKAGTWTDDEIRVALERMADEGRSVTTDALRYELTGFPGRQTNRSRALQAGVDRTRRLAERERASLWEIEA